MSEKSSTCESCIWYDTDYNTRTGLPVMSYGTCMIDGETTGEDTPACDRYEAADDDR